MTSNSIKPAAISRAAAEKEKWNAYYASLGVPEEDEITQRFNAEFCGHIDDLLPAGGRVLEAGSGGGRPRLALALTGRLQSTLLPFSPVALSDPADALAPPCRPSRFVSGPSLTPRTPRLDRFSHPR